MLKVLTSQAFVATTSTLKASLDILDFKGRLIWSEFRTLCSDNCQ